MRFWLMLGAVVGLLWSSVSFANVVITGTRIIYPAQNKEVGIELTNVESTPALLQAWVTGEDGDNAKPVPFVLTPPVFRLDGNKKQTLRLIYTHEKLPQDKESLFYFNLLDIPPMPTGDDQAQNYLQISLLSKLKLFFRPNHLKPTIEKAPQALTVALSGKDLTINNPTPYYMTISAVALLHDKDDSTPLFETTSTPMIAPFDKAIINIDKDDISQAKMAKLEVINDYGGRMQVPLTLERL